jgi:hypothetical protein
MVRKSFAATSTIEDILPTKDKPIVLRGSRHVAILGAHSDLCSSCFLWSKIFVVHKHWILELSFNVGNVGVYHMENVYRMACYARRETKDLKVMRVRGRMMSWWPWGSPFIIIVFKTLGLFNIFLTISLSFRIYHVFHLAGSCFKMGWLNACS